MRKQCVLGSTSLPHKSLGTRLWWRDIPVKQFERHIPYMVTCTISIYTGTSSCAYTGVLCDRDVSTEQFRVCDLEEVTVVSPNEVFAKLTPRANSTICFESTKST